MFATFVHVVQFFLVSSISCFSGNKMQHYWYSTVPSCLFFVVRIFWAVFPIIIGSSDQNLFFNWREPEPPSELHFGVATLDPSWFSKSRLPVVWSLTWNHKKQFHILWECYQSSSRRSKAIVPKLLDPVPEAQEVPFSSRSNRQLRPLSTKQGGELKSRRFKSRFQSGLFYYDDLNRANPAKRT